MKMSRLFATTLFAVITFAPATNAQELDARTRKFVEDKVKPLLEARCMECHSSTLDEPKGGLVLDSRTAILTGGESGPAVVAGKPGESLLVEAINYDGYEMPPRNKLPAGEIKILTEWVKLGAPLPGGTGAAPRKMAAFPLKQRMQEHWSWQPIKNHPVPKVKNQSWPADPIDHFVLAKLEEKNLTPAKQADRRTLVRRLYFDIIGLPPTPQQVAKFVNNPKSDREAIAELADELLASPHFGERWARHWLDLVRYAETLGHEFDYPLHYAHEYRDYVIRALNADVPYDQFATEHIAGDLLPSPRRHPTEGFNESLIGTGFWFLGEAKHAPVDAKGEEAAMIDNQIDVFSKTFLGLTVACARCHDHKFDAITAKDYYALAGFLQSSRKNVGMLDPGQRIATARKQMLELRQQGDKAIADALRDSLKSVTVERVREWAASNKDQSLRKPDSPLFLLASLAGVTDVAFGSQLGSAARTIAAADEKAAKSRERFEVFADFSKGVPDGWTATGYAFDTNAVTKGTEWNWQDSSGVARLAPGEVSSGTVSNKLQGFLRSPTFELKHDQIVYSAIGDKAQVRVWIEGYWMNEFNALLFNGAKVDVNTKGQRQWVRHAADVSRYKGAKCYLEIIDRSPGSISVREVGFMNRGPNPPEPPASSLQTVLKTYQPKSLDSLVAATLASALDGINGTSEPGTQLVNAMHSAGLLDASSVEGQLDGLRKKLTELNKRMPGPRQVVAITDGSSEDEHLFVRGSHKNLGEVVPRRLLSAFGTPEVRKSFGSGRLEIARQMFDGRNPYPARVMANRIWHHLFGRGVVASTDNFGVLGQRPTHPQLLDHLAIGLRENGWSVKKMIRRLVLTRTYQLSSESSAEARSLDPTNQFLQHASIRRLQGEAIRDAVLTISGRLDRKMFGGSVPVHLTGFMQGRGRPRGGPLDGNGRRSIYIKVNRNFLSPFMLAFDTPIPFTTIGRRSNSNVPAQALILMNDPFIASQAELWAKRSIKEHRDPGARIDAMYESAFARAPTATEKQRAIAFAQEQAGDQWQTNVEVWKDLCHVLINTKEFIFLN